MSGTAGLRIRPNHPQFRLDFRRWLIGADYVNLTSGIRFIQLYLGPIQFVFNF